MISFIRNLVPCYLVFSRLGIALGMYEFIFLGLWPTIVVGPMASQLKADGLKTMKRSVMLKNRVSNLWIKFHLTGEDPKGTFLYVILNYDAHKTNKVAMLDRVAEETEQLLDSITDDEIYEAWSSFSGQMFRTGQIVSPAELKWIRKYVKDERTCQIMEGTIYSGLARASNYWDNLRNQYEWTITPEKRVRIIQEILDCPGNLGPKRKMELAKEIGQSWQDHAVDYYKRLLRDRHYDQATELGIQSPEAVEEIIVNCVNGGCLNDARNITKQFLPGRQDLLDEIEEIRKSLQFRSRRV